MRAVVFVFVFYFISPFDFEISSKNFVGNAIQLVLYFVKNKKKQYQPKFFLI